MRVFRFNRPGLEVQSLRTVEKPMRSFLTVLQRENGLTERRFLPPNVISDMLAAIAPYSGTLTSANR